MGDVLLREVAKRISQQVRESDTVARVGGDEFIVLLSSLSTDKLASLCEADRVVDKLAMNLKMPYSLSLIMSGEDELNIVYHCSVSIGVALFVGKEQSQHETILKADKAMLESRDQTGNSESQVEK
jgi:diguanylate cyclase (GGDEF)-like protein